MRYGLRTLLIAVTVFGLVMARVAYLNRQRDFHRQEVQRLATQLAAFHTDDQRELERRVGVMAAAGVRARGSWIGADLPGEYGSLEYEVAITNWHLAHQHEVLANRYSRAIYRPWAFVWDDPNSVPDRVGWLDLRVVTYSAVLALAMLAAWRLLPQIIVSRKARGAE